MEQFLISTILCPTSGFAQYKPIDMFWFGFTDYPIGLASFPIYEDGEP